MKLRQHIVAAAFGVQCPILVCGAVVELDQLKILMEPNLNRFVKVRFVDAGPEEADQIMALKKMIWKTESYRILDRISHTRTLLPVFLE